MAGRDMGARTLEFFTGGDVRIFVQRGDADPSNAYYYYGRVQIDSIGITKPEAEIVRVPSDNRRRQFKTVGKVKQPPETGTASIQQIADRRMNEEWWEIIKNDETVTLQAVVGVESNPSAQHSWESVLILHDVDMSECTVGENLNPSSGDDQAEITLSGSITYGDVSIVNKCVFSEVAASEITREVKDVFSRWNGKQWAKYIITTNVALSNPSELIVDPKNTDTWHQYEPSALGTDDLIDRMIAIGDYLVLISSADEAHYYSSFADVDADTDNFTKVTGYTASKGPKAGYSLGANRTILCGLGGYLYKLTSYNATPTVVDAGVATTQNLNDIHGAGNTVVAVGASNVVVKSTDGGETWTLKTGPSVGNALTAIYCQTEDLWFVGTDNGELHYTNDGGDTWTNLNIESIYSSVNRIVFVNDSVGYIVGATSTTKGRISRTLDAGITWHALEPHVMDVPASDSYNAITVMDVNTVLAGGLADDASDGIAVFGQRI